MNYTPEGLNYGSSEDEFIDFGSNSNYYDEYRYEDKEIVAEVETSPDAFLKNTKVTNEVFVDGTKVRLFIHLREAIITQDIPSIKEFCDNVPNWDSCTDHTGLTALDYAIAFAKPISLTTILKNSNFEDSGIPVGILHSKSKNTKCDSDVDNVDNVDKCFEILGCHGFTQSNTHTKSHDLSDDVTTKISETSFIHTDLVAIFLRDTNLSSLLPSFKGLSFTSFLLMDEEDFVKLGISQPGILSRLTDAILSFHRFPWKPEALLSNENLFNMNGVELASMFRNMAEQMRLIDCSIEFARRRVEKSQAGGAEVSQAWRYQLMQLSQSKSALGKELREFKEKFRKFYKKKKLNTSSHNNFSFLITFFRKCVVVAVLPVVLYVMLHKLKS